MATYLQHYPSPLGGITLASDGTALTGLWFDGQKYFGSTLLPGCEQKDLPVFDQTAQWLEQYFSGEAPAFTPPLLPQGSPFRQAVWGVLRTIPFGQTITYGEIAARLAEQQGRPCLSAQAVGGAVGHNPISLLIPCHRVVGAGGSLTGYAGGLGRKQRLLALEHVEMAGLFLPKKGTAL